MKASPRILVLGGLPEGDTLAAVLRDRLHVDTILVRAPGQPVRPVEPGGDPVPALTLLLDRRADIADLMRWTDAVVLATHPWADRVTEVAAEVAADLRTPVLRLLRAPWRPGLRDRWVPVDDARRAAMEVVRGNFQRPLVMLGRDQVVPLAGLRGRRVMFRLPPGASLPDLSHGIVLPHSGETSVAGELALIRDNAADVLVTRNMGGQGGLPRLIAARQAGLQVIMLRRPPQPAIDLRDTPEEALAWIGARLGLDLAASVA